MNNQLTANNKPMNKRNTEGNETMLTTTEPTTRKRKKFKPYLFGVTVLGYNKVAKSHYSIISYSFHDMEEVSKWVESDLPEIKLKWNALTYKVFKLDGLKLGGKCHVRGDGNEVYEIVDVEERSKDRPCFALDSGFVEEVAKCQSIANTWNFEVLSC